MAEFAAERLAHAAQQRFLDEKECARYAVRRSLVLNRPGPPSQIASRDVDRRCRKVAKSRTDCFPNKSATISPPEELHHA